MGRSLYDTGTVRKLVTARHQGRFMLFLLVCWPFRFGRSLLLFKQEYPDLYNGESNPFIFKTEADVDTSSLCLKKRAS